jgi:hypothetical protein
VVSFFDPDSLVQRMQLGHIPNSVDEMREAIRVLLEDDNDRELTGRRAREFATREYTTGVAGRYLELLNQNSQQKRLDAVHWAKRGANQRVNQGADLP